jgi:hypothetical protein
VRTSGSLVAILEAAGAGPPDRLAVFAVMKRHGLTPALPGGGDRAPAAEAAASS